jgi:hypothetical protein
MAILTSSSFKGQAIHHGQRIPIPSSKEFLTNLSSAVTLTPPAGAKLAVIQCQNESIRFWDDGSTPTASEGVQMDDGDIYHYTGDFSTIKFIEVTSGARLAVLYYR